jgi:hypothetical protein
VIGYLSFWEIKLVDGALIRTVQTKATLISKWKITIGKWQIFLRRLLSVAGFRSTNTRRGRRISENPDPLEGFFTFRIENEVNYAAGKLGA